MTRNICSAVFLLSFILGFSMSAMAAVTEREPNDTPEQATPLGNSTSATGILHQNDRDYFRITLPAPAKITVTASGLPAECRMQVAGFAKKGTSLTTLDSGNNNTVSFNAPAGDVYIQTALSTVSSGVCSGSDWCAIQCTKQGAFYLTPFKDGRQMKNIRGTHENKPLLQPIQYSLAISSSVMPTGGTLPPTTPPVTGGRPDTPTTGTQPKKPDIPTAQLPKPVGELVKNGVMKGSGYWTPVEWYRPSNGRGEISFDQDGIRFRSQSGNTRIGVLQNINQEVSGCSSLVLSATVRADQQTLTGTGYNGREAPVAVFVRYTDMNGVLHDQLSENPNEPRNMFWNGFYYLDPTGSSITAHGTKVVKSSWYRFSKDLMQLSPRPRTIHFIGAEGAGWPVRDAKINALSLQCR